MSQTVEAGRWSEFIAKIDPPENLGLSEVTSDAAMLEIWKKSVPQNRFGEVSATLGRPDFRKKFDAAVQSGRLQEFLDEALATEDPFSNVYVVLSKPETLDTEANKNVFEHHQPEFLDRLSTQLTELVSQVKNSGMPEVFQELYHQKIVATQQFIMAARAVSTPEFTRHQQSDEAWRKLLDLDQTTQSGELRLKYEDRALKILQENKGAQPVFTSVTEVLDKVWHLSEAEKAALQFEDLTPTSETLTAQQGKKLFEILLARIGLSDWEVEDTSSSAINVTAPAKKIAFPTSRRLTADEVAFIFPHEFVHVIRGANGALQDCSLLEAGMEDYLTTEEGLATLSEMIVGQPFGHPRQVLFAARYYAIAQALKTEIDPETQQRRAKYSMQDIYDQLIAFNLSQDYATETVWRTFRGTSLKRQVVDIGIGDEQNNPVLVAETFTKDAVYFIGQMMMFDSVKSIMPILEEERNKPVIKASADFSDRVLARVGRAITKTLTEEPPADATRLGHKEGYQALVDLGRTALLSIMQYFLVGKMTFESLSDADNEWQTYLHRENVINYAKIFEPGATKPPAQNI